MKNKTTKKLAIIIAILVAISFTVVYFSQGGSIIAAAKYLADKKEAVFEYINESKAIATDYLDGQEVNSIAKIQEKVGGLEKVACIAIQNQEVRDWCYWDLARSTNDSSICVKILKKEIKDSCYFSVVIAKKDITLCDKIQTQEVKDLCKKEVTLIKQGQGNSVSGSSLPISNLPITDDIQGQIARDTCNCKLGAIKLDSSFCDKIQDKEIKKKCYADVAKAKLDASATCN